MLISKFELQAKKFFWGSMMYYFYAH